MKYATIDMGTNTIRLLIARLRRHCVFDFLVQKSMIARIGEGFGHRRLITEAALQRTRKVLSEYKHLIDIHGVKDVFVAATSAIREAENGDWFVDSLSDFGFHIEIISPEREAYLTHLGILYFQSDKLDSKRWLAFDLGGGSTEFIFSEGRKLIFTTSLPLGGVKLLERHVKHDPPLPEEIENLTLEFREALEKELPHFDPELIVGNAGTVTSLAAIDQGLTRYSHSATEGYCLKKERIERIARQMSQMSADDRLNRYKVLEKGREDVIVVGAYVVLTILEAFGAQYLITTNGSLREGLLIERVCDGRKQKESLS